MNQLTGWLCATVLGVAPVAVAQTQDATALEAQYKTCAKHYIPADKCTPEIYQQLKDKDNAPLDPTTASALKAVKEYQTGLLNPDSMQVRTAYVTDKHDVCLEIGAQNGAGGMAVEHVVLTSKGKWRKQISDPIIIDPWLGICQKKIFSLLPPPRGGAMLPGADVTDKVNLALKNER
ncbi:MAG: hypothetical protein WB562_02940 [Candidatus Sulfotelmatobacter sp.]